MNTRATPPYPLPAHPETGGLEHVPPASEHPQSAVPDASQLPQRPLIHAVGVTKSYGAAAKARGVRGAGSKGAAAVPIPVLDSIDLKLEPGEMLSIVGPSGSGKSTLLYCLAGLETADSGEIYLDGIRTLDLSAAQLTRMRRDRIGLIFQSYNLIPSLTVSENVALPARLAKRSVPDTAAALRQVGLTQHARKRSGTLSGGEQQRVAIARVLAAEPQIVFADEPTGALDTVTGGQILDLLRGYASGDRSVVLVTHDLAAAARADRTLVLRDGAILAELRGATAAELLQTMQNADDQ